MTNLLLLVKLQVYSVFSLNRLLRSRGNAKIFKLSLLLLILLLIAGYNFFTALSLLQIGEGELIPAYMIAMVSLLIFFFSLFQAGGILIHQKELDKLLPLPLRIWEIVCGKFTFLYLLGFMLALLFMLPAGILYFIHFASLADIIPYLSLIVVVPLMPLSVSVLLGSFVHFLASKMQHRNILAFLASLLLFLGLLGTSGWAVRTGGTAENVHIMLSRQLSSLYPPAVLFLKGHSFFWSSLLFVSLSLVLTVLVLRVLTAFYIKWHRFLQSRSAKSKVLRRRQKSPFMALYKKETTNFFSSYLYMLNSGLGLILLLAFALLLCLLTPQTLFAWLGFGLNRDFLPLLLASLLSISNPAAVSISLEGSQFWILQTLPIRMKDIIRAKMGLTLSLHAAGLMLSFPVLLWRFRPTIQDLLALICIPLSYSLFTSVQGLLVNIQFPKLIWDNEIVVIKQSLSAILSGLMGMLAVLFPLVLHFLFKWSLSLSLWLAVPLLVLASFVIYRYLEKQIYFKEDLD